MAEMRKYDDREILSHVDHTLLKPTATAADIDKIIDEGIRYQTASVCIPPSFVAHAAAYAKGRVKICTVIGFPNGYNTTAVKVYETEDAVNNGADEIDMVINLGDLKAGNYDAVAEEIRAVREACRGKILKVIIETCLRSCRQAAQTISRPPPAFPRAARPLRTSSCLRAMSTASASRRQAASEAWRTQSIFSTSAQTASAPVR